MVFPFFELNPNAGARLRFIVTLLHPTLIPSFSPWGVVEDHIIDSHLPVETSVENTCAANDLEEQNCYHMQDQGHTEDPRAGSQVDLGAQQLGELARSPSISVWCSWGGGGVRN
jgi:hypothetical protein